MIMESNELKKKATTKLFDRLNLELSKRVDHLTKTLQADVVKIDSKFKQLNGLILSEIIGPMEDRLMTNELSEMATVKLFCEEIYEIKKSLDLEVDGTKEDFVKQLDLRHTEIMEELRLKFIEKINKEKDNERENEATNG